MLSPSTQAAETAPAGTSFTVGGGLAIVPDYAGSDDYRAVPLIALDYQHASGFFASTRRGLGYQTRLGALGLSAAIGHTGGRSDEDRRVRAGSDELRGMGEIRSSVTAILGANYVFDGGISVGAKALLALNHRESGNRYEFGVQAPLYKGARDKLSMFAMTEYSDERNMQAYHGVSAAQSRASGYRPFTTSAGFSKVGLGVNWQRKFSDKWSLNSSAGVMQLVGDAADSPLTKKKTAPMLSSMVNYSF